MPPQRLRGERRRRWRSLSRRSVLVDVAEDLGDNSGIENAPSVQRAQLGRRVSAVDRSEAEVSKKEMILIWAPHLQCYVPYCYPHSCLAQRARVDHRKSLILNGFSTLSDVLS